MLNNNNFLLDALKYLPIKVLPAATGLLTIFILTRYLSESNYINYTFIVTTLLLINQLCGGWVNSAMMYFVPKSQTIEEENNLINQFFFIEFILSFVGVVILFISIYLGVKQIHITFIIIVTLLLQLSINFINSFLQSKRLIKAQVISTTIQAIVQIIGLLTVYFFYKDNLFVYLCIFSSSFLFSLISLCLNKHINFKFNAGKFDKVLVVSILSYSLPICIWFFSTQLYAVGDRILLKYFKITNQVVNYVAFRDLATGLSGFISMPLLFASHPIIMNLVVKENNKVEAVKVIEKNINILLLVFLPCILIVFFYGQNILGYFLSSKYVLSPINMLLILLSILVGCISIYLQKGLEVSFNTKYMLKISLFVAIMSVLLNILFISSYGVKASIIIGLICQLAYAIFIYIRSNKSLYINIKNLQLIYFGIMLAIAIAIASLLEVNTIIFYSITIVFVLVVLLLTVLNLKKYFNK